MNEPPDRRGSLDFGSTSCGRRALHPARRRPDRLADGGPSLPERASPAVLPRPGSARGPPPPERADSESRRPCLHLRRRYGPGIGGEPPILSRPIGLGAARAALHVLGGHRPHGRRGPDRPETRQGEGSGTGGPVAANARPGPIRPLGAHGMEGRASEDQGRRHSRPSPFSRSSASIGNSRRCSLFQTSRMGVTIARSVG